MSDLARQVADSALAAALDASDIVMDVYATSFEVQYKGKDDPVTRADREANTLIVERLSRVLPGLPVVAEESEASTYAGYASGRAAFFVDPLDGTREFVAKNGQFAVMIGLAEGGRATLGVIVAPAWKRAFIGIVGDGAWERSPDGTRTPIHVSERDRLDGASIVVSRSRTSAKVASLASDIAGRPPTPHGSSGLKAVLVATGVHDVYLQPGPAGMRWDACASEALIVAAGGRFTDAFGEPIDYAAPELTNTRGILATNGRIYRAMLEALTKRRLET